MPRASRRTRCTIITLTHMLQVSLSKQRLLYSAYKMPQKNEAQASVFTNYTYRQEIMSCILYRLCQKVSTSEEAQKEIILISVNRCTAVMQIVQYHPVYVQCLQISGNTIAVSKAKNMLALCPNSYLHSRVLTQFKK